MADALPAGVGDGVNRPTVLFTRVLPDHRPATVHVPSLAEQVAAPPQAASAAFAAPLTKWSWHVPAHAALETFLHSSGPSDITRYNFALVKRGFKDNDLARRQPYLPGGAYSERDTLILTEHGETRRKLKPHLRVFTWELACTGQAAHGKQAPNCQRRCGGFGCCLDTCQASGARRVDRRVQ